MAGTLVFTPYEDGIVVRSNEGSVFVSRRMMLAHERGWIMEFVAFRDRDRVSRLVSSSADGGGSPLSMRRDVSVSYLVAAFGELPSVCGSPIAVVVDAVPQVRVSVAASHQLLEVGTTDRSVTVELDPPPDRDVCAKNTQSVWRCSNQEQIWSRSSALAEDCDVHRTPSCVNSDATREY
jgi:hypothetical protein